MKKIKHLLLSAIIACTFVPCLDARTKVPVQKEPDPPLDGIDQPSRAPYRDEALVDVSFDNNNSYLYIELLYQSAYVSYSIVDNASEMIVVSNSGYLDEEEELAVDLSSLPNGSYTLILQIDNSQFSGCIVLS